MAAPLVKSGVYLGVFGFIGYVLMKISEPSEEKKKAIARTGYRDPAADDAKTQKALFLKKLQEATTDTPIYLKKPVNEQPGAPQQPTKREIN